MAIEKFDLATLATLDDGRIRTAFEHALARLVEDCKDRPNVKAKRVLALTVSIVPVPDDEGDLSSVDVDFALKETAPKRESRSYNMLPTRKGLAFNELSPDEARQMTLDQASRPRVAKSEYGSAAEEIADAL